MDRIDRLLAQFIVEAGYLGIFRDVEATHAALDQVALRQQIADEYRALVEALERAHAAIAGLSQGALGRDVHTGHYYRDELLDKVASVVARDRGESDA